MNRTADQSIGLLRRYEGRALRCWKYRSIVNEAEARREWESDQKGALVATVPAVLCRKNSY